MGVKQEYVHLGFKENGKFIRKWVAFGLGKHKHIYKRAKGGLMGFSVWSLSGHMSLGI